MNKPKEYLDLVDADDKIIGRVDRDAKDYGGYINFRVINAFVVNQEGKIWIPRRAEDKRIFPGCLDMSVGGHVDSGETYEESFRRETKEELNIDIDKVDWEELGYLNSFKVGTSAFMKVYRINLEETPDYNHRDFTEAYWLTPEEVLVRIRHGEKVKGDLGQLIRLFFIAKNEPKGT